MAVEVRTARTHDKAGIRELWKLRFGDTESFMDWFFSKRYFPEYSACLLEDGVIMSAMQGYPMHIRLREHTLPALMLAGVSTHPERSGRGYMREVFLHFMQIARSAAIPLVIHTPAHMPTFFSRGHYQAADTLRYTEENARADAMPACIHPHSMSEDLTPLLLCHQRMMANYSGSVSRSGADFYYKFQDYAADGGKALVREENGKILGYCAYYKMDDLLHAEECAAYDFETLSLLIDALRFEAAGRKLTIKLPPDYPPDEKGGVSAIKQQGAMGIADICAALRLLVNDASFIFEVHDQAVPQNAGIFDGLGNISEKKPQFIAEAGRFGQLLGAYASLDELVSAGHIQARDPDAAHALSILLPKKPCFIVDEY